MSVDGRCQCYALGISEPLFRLMTESVRLHSNDTGRLHTLDTLVADRAMFAQTLEHNLETVRMHFDAVPSEGDIRIELAVSPDIAASLEDAKKALKALIGSDLSLADTLSIMLFDYMVEQKANKVRAKLGLGKPDRSTEDTGRRPSGDDNVMRLK